MGDTVSIPQLHRMKQDGRKIVGVVAWDYQMACIVDRAGVEIISVGDSVGINLWGQPNPLEVTMDQMVTVAQARREVSQAEQSTISLTPEEQLAFWNALNATPNLTKSQRELGKIMRGDK